jgi:hypothetical protein
LVDDALQLHAQAPRSNPRRYCGARRLTPRIAEYDEHEQPQRLADSTVPAADQHQGKYRFQSYHLRSFSVFRTDRRPHTGLT